MNYLKNKHKGGVSSEKGLQYEMNYAVYKIACYLLACNEHSVRFQTQIEGAYVDDLLITVDDDVYNYHQIKNVKGLKWATVESDFIMQSNQCTERSENFTITLVYSDPQFSTTLSEELKPHTNTLYFPYTTSLYGLINTHTPFKDALKELSAYDDPSEDLLYGIAEAIAGIWLSSNRMDGASITDIADRLKKSEINTVLDPDAEIAMECKTILDAIPDFSYEIKGKKIIWYSDSFSGSTLWTSRLQNEIIENAPSTAKDIFKML